MHAQQVYRQPLERNLRDMHILPVLDDVTVYLYPGHLPAEVWSGNVTSDHKASQNRVSHLAGTATWAPCFDLLWQRDS